DGRREERNQPDVEPRRKRALLTALFNLCADNFRGRPLYNAAAAAAVDGRQGPQNDQIYGHIFTDRNWDHLPVWVLHRDGWGSETARPSEPRVGLPRADYGRAARMATSAGNRCDHCGNRIHR